MGGFLLTLALPRWYFPLLLSPWVAGIFSAFCAAGILCLIVGLVTGIWARDRRLFTFFVPAVLSQIFVGMAGVFGGELQNAGWLLLTFLGGQLLLSLVLAGYARAAPVPALALTFFSLSYALFAAFIAGMGFTGDWL